MPKQTPAWLQGFLVFIMLAGVARGQTLSNPVFAKRAEDAFTLAQKDYAAHPNDTNAQCVLGRTTYDWAEFATNADQRGAIAQAGVNACLRLVAKEPKFAPGHYYLAMDYGELAEAEEPSLAAYKLIHEIEREFKTAADLDERYDYAGPVRCLGLLYRDAPGWPISIGSKHNAREYLERAVELAPDFPENQMNLLESCVRWHEKDEAEAVWHKLVSIWPVAKTNLTGVTWEQSWDDWNHRRVAVRAEFEKNFKRAMEPDIAKP